MPDLDARVFSINAKVSEVERREICEAAQIRGLTTSEFLRELGLREARGSCNGGQRLAVADGVEVLLRAMRSSLENGDSFGVPEFDALVREVSGRG